MNDSLSREEVELLLPFYLNGTLDESEKQQVEQAFENHPALEEELNFLRELKTEVQAMPMANNSPGEMGLKRLQRQLAAKPMTDAQVSSRWRWAAVAASFLLVVQTSVMILTPGPAGYQQAGEQQTSPLIQVSFKPETTEAEIRQLLLQYQLSIVEGPSALGFYKLSVMDDARVTAEQLQQQPIIDFVQLNP
ncbi:anti-sigma factor family protein [Methylophaga sp. OBS1]|uniref:anti-sigma factor family protein n=1 Tax=Methylophaga sp. OBS1 TaxID=2991933 RepID=UPI00224EF59C|nr:hypothetical protein [Methylophaga sp. OBS1]MCX4192333.1 hypothetical protein [Methylophaga sp. OBS1]